jgi:hypothetical protein
VSPASKEASVRNANGRSDDYAGLLIDRLAATIIDDSLPLKEVERDLRGSVAEVALKRRGLDKRETANRCGVTEKSIENYLKEARSNPKSPEREVARALQDEMLTLEEVYEKVSPVLAPTRNFTLDDAKRALEKLIRTGEVKEYPGHRYRAVDRPAIRYPSTLEAHRELVDQKARDLDYVVLRQKEATEVDLGRRGQRYSRVVGDSNLVRIDFTVDVAEGELPEFYEKLSEAIAKITMGEEKKRGKSRVRLILAMRAVKALLLLALLGGLFSLGSWFRAPLALAGEPGAENGRSWELDRVGPQDADADHPAANEDGGGGGGSLEQPGGAAEGVGVSPDGDEEEYAGGEDPDGAAGPAAAGEEPERPIVPGDVNGDEVVDIADVLFLISYVNLGGAAPECDARGDVDGNGIVDLQDAFVLLSHLYLGTELSPPDSGFRRGQGQGDGGGAQVEPRCEPDRAAA